MIRTERNEKVKENNMKNYVVLDLLYTPDEGQECFEGTFDECQEFISQQGGGFTTYEIVPRINLHMSV